MFGDEEYWDVEYPAEVLSSTTSQANTNGNYNNGIESNKSSGNIGTSFRYNNEHHDIYGESIGNGFDEEDWDADPTWIRNDNNCSDNSAAKQTNGKSNFGNESLTTGRNNSNHGFGDMAGNDNRRNYSTTVTCYKCGEIGHMSNNCEHLPKQFDDNQRRPRRACYKCGDETHLANNCCSTETNEDQRQRKVTCYKCGKDGHISRDCKNQISSRNCYKCGEEGHIASDCNTANLDNKQKNRPPPYIPPPPSEDDDLIFSAIPTGINFNNYDSIPVEVSGVNAPSHINTFDEAELTQTIRTNVFKSKYLTPTPVQKYSIPITNAGRDLMACAQTGSGKTAAFLLPVLSGMIRSGLQTAQFSERQTPQAIVVGPTRELIRQIFDETRKFSRNTVIKPFMAYGGTAINNQLEILTRGCNILIATPGRLQDLIRRERIGLEYVQYLILDEADRMLSMNFETAIRELASAPGFPDKTNRQTLLFSATFPDDVQKLAHDFLKEDFIFLTIGRIGGACTDVTQHVLKVDQDDKRETLIELLNDVPATGAKTLVFVDTKRNADFLASFLSQEELPTTSIHGDRPQREREMALRDFTTGTCPIMIATSVAARGLDIPKVEHVINYDLPKEIDEYVHRIGRTGRCGNLGQATSFYCEFKDGGIARPLVKVLRDANQIIPEWLEENAANSMETSHGANRGRFGARDARRGRGRGHQLSRQYTPTNREPRETFSQNGWNSEVQSQFGSDQYAEVDRFNPRDNTDSNQTDIMAGFGEESWD
uniref:ATP-dependent RNA helicase DDX4-like n=1 Tax=Styela clava TaxID=7725 RepID=UPI0019399614|nr:ATP-dependent RNA helicase DDX4-like [Styela clava]